MTPNALVCCMNADGIVERVSPNIKEFMGFDESELLSSPWLSLAHPHDLEVTSRAFKSLTETHWCAHVENRCHDRSGNYKLFSWSLILDAKSARIHAMGRVLGRPPDLDAQKLKSIRLSKLALIGEIAPGIAHEINNPLAIIQGTLQLLPQYFGTPEKLNSRLQTLQQSFDRIATIVQSLNRFTRSSDLVPIAPKSLEALLGEAITLTASRSKFAAVAMEVDCQSSARILCNEIKIEQVLINLLHNAIDAAKSQPIKWVKVTVTDDHDHVVLRVTDSGPGIPDTLLAQIFGEGTGLSLSITRKILAEHQASIEVIRNCPSTCLEVRFPSLKSKT